MIETLPYTPAFNALTVDLGNGNELCIVRIEEIDERLSSFIDEQFVSICEGKSSSELQEVKARLITFLSTKTGSTTEMGAIAEFLLHLYLKEIGFTQLCLFFNLEEGSIKKGFDGYYSGRDKGEQWILESKSGSIKTQSISHASKVKEAYQDLNDKISGKTTNDPWRNAYNHASLIQVAAETKILEQLKSFTTQYQKKIFQNISFLNVIPGATIFLDGTWEDFDDETLAAEIKEIISTTHYHQIKVICITKKSLNLFLSYLQEVKTTA